MKSGIVTCEAASVNLLTRKIRVPVPSMRQLDKAGSESGRANLFALRDIDGSGVD